VGKAKFYFKPFWLRYLLLALSACGIVLFVALFVTSYAKQDQLELAAQGFIQYQIKTELTARYPALVEADIPDHLKKLQDKFSDEANRTKTMMDAKVDQMIADAISNLCGDNCTSKKDRRESFRNLFENKFERTSAASKNMTVFIEGKYMQVLTDLRRDFRVFSSVNIVAFATVFLALLLKYRARTHLIVPSALLILSALIAIYFYLFQQNWLFTILHGNYWGYAYAIYMVIIYGFLLDIIINRGRVTTSLLNGLGGINISIC